MSFSLTPTGLVLKAAGYYILRSYTAMLFVLSAIAAVATAKITCKSPFEPKQRCSVTEGLYGQNYSSIQISEFRCFNQFQGPWHDSLILYFKFCSFAMLSAKTKRPGCWTRRSRVSEEQEHFAPPPPSCL